MMRLPQLLHRDSVRNFSLPSQNEPWGAELVGGLGGNLPSALRVGRKTILS